MYTIVRNDKVSVTVSDNLIGILYLIEKYREKHPENKYTIYINNN